MKFYKKEFSKLLKENGLTVCATARLIEHEIKKEYPENKIVVAPQTVRYWSKPHPKTGLPTSPKDQEVLEALASLFDFSEVINIKNGFIQYLV